jgi:primosomal protein N' (replication factor Y)
LIVVDEEHDGSYKQYDASPRYQGRDTAIMRGKFNEAVVLLGSATPSMESYSNAVAGKYRLLELPDRIDHARMPEVRLVDMIAERKRRFEETKKKVKETGIPFPKQLGPMSISGTLQEEIAKRLERKEGVILLQNRRGFAHVLECLECGYTERCKNCDVTMTYHLKSHDLRCHYCGAHRPSAKACPSCLKGELKQLSFGTQQVHEELQALFPKARILRMDRDTTRRKGSHESLLRRFGAGEADILLGTQMVAKGLDFPHVTLVGVISAETQLLLPDFRSAETTFQLLTQVAGRSGRSYLRGEVLIQTVQPQHYSLRHATSHDYQSFYNEEVKFRQELRYPPVTRLVLIEATGKNENAVAAAAEVAARTLRRAKIEGIEVLGPAEPPIARLRNLYRRHVLIKGDKRLDPSGEAVRRLLAPLVEEGSGWEKKQVRVTVDVDPYGML